MKKIFFYLIFLLSVTIVAQSSSDLMEYYTDLKSKGFTDLQIKKIANDNGYNLDNLFESLNSDKSLSEDQEVSTPLSNQNYQSSYKNYSQNSNPTKNQGEGLKVFGSQYFEKLNFDFSPQINIATPPNYQLGPGDGITISLWGASQKNYLLELDKSGNIFIDGIGPVYLSGYTITDAKSKIYKSLSVIYSGLISNNTQKKVNLDLSLRSSRSVFVNIVGQVNAPGLYTLNGMSNIIHALYAAGGVDSSGSYRNIEIIRKNKVISKVDLYDYFTSGKLPTIFMQDQDVIRVPYYKNRVSLQGEVKFQGLFELKEFEKIKDLFNYSGGKTAKSKDKNYLISRIQNSQYFSKNIKDDNFKLLNGDKIFVYKISNQTSARVSVNGQVLVPGYYSSEAVNTIEDLINLSKGFTSDAYLEYATLFRNKKNQAPTILSVGLNSNDFNLNLNEKLVDRDSLVVYKKGQFLPLSKINIQGNIIKPGKYDYYNGMSLQDLLALSQGISDPGEDLRVIIKRYDNKSKDYSLHKEFETYDFQGFSRIILKAMDFVSVIKKNTSSPIRVSIKGEVNNPGIYIQTKKSNSVAALINEAGGLTEFASDKSIFIKRKTLFNESKIINDSLIDNSIDSRKDFTFIPINNLDTSYYFQDNDQLVVNPLSDDVTLSGEVLKSSVIKYKSQKLKYYIQKAGIGANGSKRDIFVLYPNKDISSAKNFLFFRSYPKVTPGCEIFVSPKPKRSRLTSQEVIGISSGLSTLMIVIATLITN